MIHRPRISPTLRRLLIGAIMGWAVSSTPAEASDAKYFNGAFCRASFAFGSPSPQTFAKYSGNGSVANRDFLNPLEVVCPIVRDNVSNLNGWDSVEIGYFDRRPGAGAGQISCTAWHGSFVDGSLSFSQPGLSEDTPLNVWSKAGMTLGPNGNSFVDGYYLIRCVIPTAPDTTNLSGIAYYRVQEP